VILSLRARRPRQRRAVARRGAASVASVSLRGAGPPARGTRHSHGAGGGSEPAGVAGTVTGFMEALDLRDVTLVGNDPGGAVCQIVVAEHPGRIGRLVLTNCDAYEAFFPLLFSPLQHGARLFGTRFVESPRVDADGASGPTPAAKGGHKTADGRGHARRLLLGPSSRRGGPQGPGAVSRAGLEPLHVGGRPRLSGFLPSGAARVGGGRSLFTGAFSPPPRADVPDATLEFVSGSRALVPEARPERLAELIEGFADRTAGAAVVGRNRG
jgi:pimeloyl-ACP methyl ester carboxylesterase